MRLLFYILCVLHVLFLMAGGRLAAAQSVSTLMGARAASLGNASETLSDEWAMLNNPAGLAKVRTIAIASAADVHPALEGGNRIAVALSAPLRGATLGLAAFRFGDAVYDEQIISAGYGNKLGLASLGLKINYIQYAAQGAGNRGALSMSFGGIAVLTPFVNAGAFITNVNQPTISKADHEKLPTQLNAGVGIKPSDQFLFVVGIQTDLNSNPLVKTGVEYNVNSAFAVRAGFNLHPDSFYFGFGVRKKKIKIDYALEQNALLGPGHHLSMIYVPRRN